MNLLGGDIKINDIEALLLLVATTKDFMHESLHKWIAYENAGQKEKADKQWKETRYYEELMYWAEEILKRDYTEADIAAAKAQSLHRLKKLNM